MSTHSTAQTLIALLGERLGAPATDLIEVDWPALIDLARRNRVAALVQASLTGRTDVPAQARRELLGLAQRSFVETTLLAQALPELAALFAGVPWALLRGPALGASLYGDLMLRPYGDLDVLAAPEHIEAAIALLQSAGFRLPASALPPNYYRAYHLHLPFVRPGPAGRLAVELHWAIDHPFSLYTIDVPGLLARRRTVQIEQAAVPVPEPGDLFLTLALHTVKHAVQLPYWVELGQVERVTENGSVLALLDIALALQVEGPKLDWACLAERAEAWGASAAARACLDGVEALWPGAVAVPNRTAFAAQGVGRWQRAAYAQAGGADEPLLQMRPGAFFRPIRLLDAWQYIFAPADYLRRRYSSAGLGQRARHGLRAVGQLGGGLAALIYYSLGHALARAFRAPPAN